MDVESATVFGDTPFERTIAVMVGLAALLAASLALLQQDSSRNEERALILSARLSVSIFEGTAASGSFSSFQLGSTREVAGILVEAAGRGIAAFEEPTVRDAVLAISNAYLESDRDLRALAREMGRPPTPADGVDPHTIEAATAPVQGLVAVVEEQNRQVDRAERYGARNGRATLAISLLAVGAVLLGLAGVTGAGRRGWGSLAVAILLLAAAAGVGVTALLT